MCFSYTIQYADRLSWRRYHLMARLYLVIESLIVTEPEYLP
jgi:hypothetical protein